MAKKQTEAAVETLAPTPETPPGPLTLGELFDYISKRGAERVQLIRVTGSGRLDATIIPRDLGNILIVLEVNPNKGVVV